MVYPAFPVVGSSPAFLDPYDPAFMHESQSILYADSGSGVADLPRTGGGAVITEGLWAAGPQRTPAGAIFGWAYINVSQIVAESFVAVTHIVGQPQIIGPRFAYILVAPGGLPILT